MEKIDSLIEKMSNDDAKKLIKKIEKKTNGTYILCKEIVEEYLKKGDWRIKDNSNSSYSLAGLEKYISAKVCANYWLNNVYSKKAGEANRSGDLHIHDLSSLAVYCLGFSLDNLCNFGILAKDSLKNIRPAKHFYSILGQMSSFLLISQSEAAGAVAFSSFDTYLAPYVFKDNLTIEEVEEKIEAFIIRLNLPLRAGGESPFSNLTIDFTVPEDLKDKIPLVNDKHLFRGIKNEILQQKAKERGVEKLEDLTYKHFQKEMEMIDIAFYRVLTKGNNDAPWTFPIPTVNITEDFDWNSPASKEMLKNTAKMGNSYFQNFLGSQYKKDENGNKIRDENAYSPKDVRSMCCRLQLDKRELLKRGGGLFGSDSMTGSIGVVTINMARIFYNFKNDKYGAFKQIEKMMDLSKDILEKRREFVVENYDRGLYPYLSKSIRNFNNHFSTIGLNGMNEAIRNFTNDKNDISDEFGIALAKEVLEFMRKKAISYQEETGNLYNLEATPSESACFKLAKLDIEKYPDILQAGTKKNNYYTNSTQLHSGFTDDPFEALELQDDLQTLYTGGTVLHLYLGENSMTLKSCEKLIKKALSNNRLPYLSITPVFSVCDEHGYMSGKKDICTVCGKKTKVYTRVMGYYRSMDSFNIGKKGEHDERVLFKADV